MSGLVSSIPQSGNGTVCTGTVNGKAGSTMLENGKMEEKVAEKEDGAEEERKDVDLDRANDAKMEEVAEVR